MKTHGQAVAMTLRVGVLGSVLGVVTHAQQAAVTMDAPGGLRITITDLGLLPGGTASSGLAINNQPTIIGLANDAGFDLHRPFWDASTGAIVGLADNGNPSSTAIPEHMNDKREMAGTEMYGDNVYQGIFWDSAGHAFALPAMAGVDPFYGGLHTKAHSISVLGQIAGSGKEAGPDFFTHAVLWPDKDTEAVDLGFLGQGIPLNSSEAYGVNDWSHVVGVGAVGTLQRGFLWRDGQMLDLGALGGQVVSAAYAINNRGLIAGRSNFYPVMWEYDIADPESTPAIQQLPIPIGFFDGVPRAVNDSGDVVGYAGAPGIFSHAILWRDGLALDLGVWPGGHYSVANGINERGQIIGTGTIAGDNLDHALMWTLDDGSPWMDLGHGLPGASGLPALSGDGSLQPLAPMSVSLDTAPALAPTTLVVGFSELNAPFKGGLLVPAADLAFVLVTDGSGSWLLEQSWPTGVPSGFALWMQVWIAEVSGPLGYVASNGLLATTP